MADNIMLLYCGDYTYGNPARKRWKESEVTRLLAHTYKTGNKVGQTRWLFSGFMYYDFRRSISNDTARYFAKNTDSTATFANKDDYEWLLGRYFSEETINGEHETLRGLDNAIENLKQTLGEPPTRHKVYIGVPSPHYSSNFDNTPWGSIDDVPMNPGIEEDKETIIHWFVDEVINTFNAKNYQNIDLAGILWIEESMSDNLEITSKAGEYVHSKGLPFCWIPFSNALGRLDGDKNNMDYSWLQTGYFWKDYQTKEELRHLIQEALTHGMSMEYEYSYHLMNDGVVNEDYMQRLTTLTDEFEKFGIFDNFPITYYEGSYYLRMLDSLDSNLAAHMDRLCELFGNKKELPSYEHTIEWTITLVEGQGTKAVNVCSGTNEFQKMYVDDNEIMPKRSVTLTEGAHTIQAVFRTQSNAVPRSFLNQQFVSNGTKLMICTPSNCIVPDNVTSLGRYAFSNCDGYVEFKSIIPPKLSTESGGRSSLVTGNTIIYVPNNSVNQYKQEWPEYTSRIKPVSEKPNS